MRVIVDIKCEKCDKIVSDVMVTDLEATHPLPEGETCPNGEAECKFKRCLASSAYTGGHSSWAVNHNRKVKL